MAINAVIRFLKAARSMAQRGMKKEQIIDFARREFGEVSKLLKKQIDDIFKAKPKTEKKGEVVPIKKKEGIETIKGEINPETHQLPDKQREFLGFPNRSVEAIVRTAARDVLEKAGLGPRIKDQDPIDMARQISGELLDASSYPEISRILTEKKIYNFKPRQGLDVRQKGEIEDITVFDPGGRKPNADGGIMGNLHLNRIGFEIGSKPYMPEPKSTQFTLGFSEMENMENMENFSGYLSENILKDIIEGERKGMKDVLLKMYRNDPEKLLNIYLGMGPEKAEIGFRKKFSSGSNLMTRQLPQISEEMKKEIIEKMKGTIRMFDIMENMRRTKGRVSSDGKTKAYGLKDGGLIDILKL